jgi:hypothetical protein
MAYLVCKITNIEGFIKMSYSEISESRDEERRRRKIKLEDSHCLISKLSTKR